MIGISAKEWNRYCWAASRLQMIVVMKPWWNNESDAHLQHCWQNFVNQAVVIWRQRYKLLYKVGLTGFLQIANYRSCLYPSEVCQLVFFGPDQICYWHITQKVQTHLCFHVASCTTQPKKVIFQHCGPSIYKDFYMKCIWYEIWGNGYRVDFLWNR